MMRRLLLAAVLVLPTTTGLSSVAASAVSCYVFEVSIPPYAPTARVCPFPPISG